MGPALLCRLLGSTLGKPFSMSDRTFSTLPDGALPPGRSRAGSVPAMCTTSIAGLAREAQSASIATVRARRRQRPTRPHTTRAAHGADPNIKVRLSAVLNKDVVLLFSMDDTANLFTKCRFFFLQRILVPRLLPHTRPASGSRRGGREYDIGAAAASPSSHGTGTATWRHLPLTVREGAAQRRRRRIRRDPDGDEPRRDSATLPNRRRRS